MQASSSTSKFWLPAIFFVATLALWQFGVPVSLRSYLLPAPSSIVHELYTNSQSLRHHTAVTLAEASIGFIMANAIAFVLAILAAYSRTAEHVIYPYAIALKTAPLVALAPMLVVWFGTGLSSKVVASAVICFFPMLINGIRGLRRADADAVELFRSLGAGDATIFFKLRLPSALPYIFSALKISSSLSIVGAIVGEFVGAQQGLGYLITVASYHFEVATMFAAVVAASAIGIAFFGIIAICESFMVPWGELEEHSV